MNRGIGPLLVVLGGVLVGAGLLVWSGALAWFGQLPGDVRLEGERTRVFIPVTSMLVLSVVLTVMVNLLSRWWR